MSRCVVLLSPNKIVAMTQLYTSPVKLSNPQRFITINCIFLLFFHTLLLLSFFFFSVSALQLWPQSLNSRFFRSVFLGNILVHNVPAFTRTFVHGTIVSLQLCTVLDFSSLLSFLGTCSVMAALFVQSHVKAFCTKNKKRTKKLQYLRERCRKKKKKESRILAKAKEKKSVKLRIFLWFYLQV